MKKTWFALILSLGLILAGCGSQEESDPVKYKGDSDIPHIAITDELKDGDVNFDSSFLPVSKEDFHENFNIASKRFKIKEIIELNDSHNLVFVIDRLDGTEMQEQYYVTAVNDPSNNKLISLALSESEVNGLDVMFNKNALEDLMGGIYRGLYGNMLEVEGFFTMTAFMLSDDLETEERTSFKHQDLEVFSERSTDGITLAFYPGGTMSSFQLSQNS